MADQLETLTNEASTFLADLGNQLRGAGAEPLTAYQELTRATSLLPGVGENAAEAIRALKADDSLPGEHRARRSEEIYQANSVAIDKIAEAAQGAVKKLESALAAALRPSTSPDPQLRQLRRQEALLALGNTQGLDRMQRMAELVGTGRPYTAELLSEDFGRELLAPDEWKTFGILATDHLMRSQGGTDRQQAARRALAVFKGGMSQAPGGHSGTVQAFHVAARLKLEADRPARQSQLTVGRRR